MFWVSKKYVKIWKVFELKDKYADLSVGTSEKNRDGEYVNSRWPARAIGHAFQQLKKGEFKEGDTVSVTSAKLSNESYKDESGEWKTNLRLVILEIAPAGTDGLQPEEPSESKAPPPRAVAQEKAVEAAPQPEPAGDEEDPW